MSRLRLFRSSSNEWIAPLIVFARGLVSVGNCVPFPYVNTALSSGLALLELIQMVGKSGDDLKYLAESVVAIMKLLRDEMDAHPTLEDNKFKKLCQEFADQLTQVSKDLETISKNRSSSRFRKYFNADNVREEIGQFTRRVNDLRANATLIAATGTRMDLVGVASQMAAVDSRISELHLELAGQRTSRTVDATEGIGQELARFEDDFYALKLGDIHIDFRSARTANFDIEMYPNGRQQIGWTDYKATVNGGIRTVRVYQGSNSTESWKGFLFFLAENSPVPSSPYLPQLFGFCSSPKFRSLVFHGEYRTLDEYGATLPSAHAIVDWEVDLAHDYTRWLCSWDSRSHLHRRALRQFALVDGPNGKLIFSHVAELSGSASIEFNAQDSPFLAWFVLSNIPVEFNLVTETEEDLRTRLESLVYLQRGVYPAWFHPNILLSRGCVYYDDETGFPQCSHIAGLEGREVIPDPNWHVVRELYVETDFEGIMPNWPPDDCSPTADDDDEVASEFTHFIVPLMGASRKWISPQDHHAQCGYFLIARIEFGGSVPDISFTWMAQAASVFSTSSDQSDMREISRFLLPTSTNLELMWELTLKTDDTAIASEIDILQHLPEKIHVFVEVPKIEEGQVVEPRVYWSTDPDTVKTGNIPSSALAIRMRFSTSMDAVRWETHHYEVAEALQERHGFNPKTDDAANFLNLPLLKVEPFKQDALGELFHFRVLHADS
ncbi:hypothetical protein C8R47DRAFT_1246957 [Mycena vitilis]|nr:hypothetical protein C8R47DRAFT_1246957 [Mycena vitilis]